MAYNAFFPATYQPYYGMTNPYYQQSQQTQQPTIQQSGFVLVQSEQEARAYPVAPGNSVTFKDERQPYCYVKTMGFNQLDRPVFEKYRLVKEDDAQERTESPVTKDSAEALENTPYALKSDLAALWDAIEALKAKAQKNEKAKAKKVIEIEADDDDE